MSGKTRFNTYMEQVEKRIARTQYKSNTNSEFITRAPRDNYLQSIVDQSPVFSIKIKLDSTTTRNLKVAKQTGGSIESECSEGRERRINGEGQQKRVIMQQEIVQDNEKQRRSISQQDKYSSVSNSTSISKISNKFRKQLQTIELIKRYSDKKIHPNYLALNNNQPETCLKVINQNAELAELQDCKQDHTDWVLRQNNFQQNIQNIGDKIVQERSIFNLPILNNQEKVTYEDTFGKSFNMLKNQSYSSLKLKQNRKVKDRKKHKVSGVRLGSLPRWKVQMNTCGVCCDELKHRQKQIKMACIHKIHFNCYRIKYRCIYCNR